MIDKQKVREAFERDNISTLAYLGGAYNDRTDTYNHHVLQKSYELFKAGAAWQAAQPVQVDEEEIWRKLFNAIDFYCERNGVRKGFLPRNTIMDTIRPYLRTPQQPQPEERRAENGTGAQENDAGRVENDALAKAQQAAMKAHGQLLGDIFIKAGDCIAGDTDDEKRIVALHMIAAIVSSAIQKGTGHDE